LIIRRRTNQKIRAKPQPNLHIIRARVMQHEKSGASDTAISSGKQRVYCPILVYIDCFILYIESLIPFLYAFLAAEQGKISLLEDLFMGITRTDYSVTL
jgi:hypothetical protein